MVNRVTMIGNLTKDPELRNVGAAGTAVVQLGLALNRKFVSNGEKKEETVFVDVDFWGKQAEIIAQYCKKGRQLYIEGRLSLDTWEDSEGGKRSKLKVVGENFQFLGAKGDSDSASGDSSPSAERQAPSQPVVVDVEDDDIPF